MGCHFLLLGIFPTQGSNHISCIGRWISYHHAMWEALTSLRETFSKCLLNQTNPNTLLMYHFVHLPLNSQCYNAITLVSIFLTIVSILFKSRYSGFSKPEGIRISMVREITELGRILRGCYLICCSRTMGPWKPAVLVFSTLVFNFFFIMESFGKKEVY